MKDNIVMLSTKNLDATFFCPDSSEHTSKFSHPRVFLKFDSAGFARCPYCSKRYQQIAS